MSQAQQERFAHPHTPRGQPTAKWDLPATPGAGALVSAIADLLAFIEAHLDKSKTGVAVLSNRGMDDLSILFPKASVEEVGLGVLEFLNT